MKLIGYGFSGPLVIFLLLVFAEPVLAQNSGRQVPSLLPRSQSATSPRPDSRIDEESLQSFVRRFKRDVMEEQNQDSAESDDFQQQDFPNHPPVQPQAVPDPRFRSVGYPNTNNGTRNMNHPRGYLRSVQDFDPSPSPPQDDDVPSTGQKNPIPGFNPFSDSPNELFGDDPKSDASVLEPKSPDPGLRINGRFPERNKQQRQPQEVERTRKEPEQREPQDQSQSIPQSKPWSQRIPEQAESPFYQPQQMDYLPNFSFHPDRNGGPQASNRNYPQSYPQSSTGTYHGQTSHGYGPEGVYDPGLEYQIPQYQAPYVQSPHHPYDHPGSHGQSMATPNPGSNGGFFADRRPNYSGIAGKEFLITENGCENDCGFECELPIFYLSAFGYSTDLKNLVSSSTTLHTNNGGGFGFALGQRQGDNLRMELEYSFRTNDLDGATSLVGRRDLTGKVKSQSGMANVYWEMVNFPHSRLKPYFGAGIGFARLDSEVFDSAALPATLGRMKDSSFAHQYIAGVNYKGFRNVDLFIEYRLFNADPFQVQNAGVEKYDYETTNLGGGLRWKF